MSFDSLSDQPQPQPEPPRPSGSNRRRLGRVPRAAMVGGLAVGLAIGGAGIAFAATSSSTTPSTTAPPNATRPGHPFGGFKGPGGPFGGRGGIGVLGRVVHGQFTTRTASGGYQTVEVQTGKVTSVSATSISVTSADGYSHTYGVTASSVVDSQRDGISSVAKGDQVQVTATTVSGKATVTSIVDTTKVGASRKGFGFGPRARPAAPAPAAAPAAPPAPAPAAAAE